jgi:hypothetical protein
MPPQITDNTARTAYASSEALRATNPYVFVVGCPRSGTTLLRVMLDQHPQLAVTNDAAFIVKTIRNVYPQLKKRRISRGYSPPMTAEVVDYLLQSHRIDSMGLTESQLREMAGRCETYTAFVAAVYDQYARLHGKSLAGDKTPDYARRLPMLHAMFPQARIIHIIRDGRDVALSTREWVASEPKGPCNFALWNQHPMGTIALWWRWLVNSGRRDGAALGPALYHEIRYESLLANSEAALRELTDFLELPFAEQMLRYHEKSQLPALPNKRHRLPPTPGLRDWPSQMTSNDVELFELLAGDLLSELGYSRVSASLSADIRATAESCRHWWFSDGCRS